MQEECTSIFNSSLDPSQIAPAVFIKKCLELTGTVLEKERRVRIFIFGSRALGQAVPQSDIDLGIDIGHPVSPLVMDRIREEFEQLPIFQKVDVVDFSSVDQDFKKVALKHSILLYDRQAA